MKVLRTVALGLALVSVIWVAGCKTTDYQDFEAMGVTEEDAAMKTQIVQQLRADPELSMLPIQVNVAKGVVTLSGTVPNTAAGLRAYSAAASVQGVVDIVNKLHQAQ